MYQKERLNNILELVRRQRYVTVKYLVSHLHYSNATINRDLNVLVEQKLIRRSYGGVEIAEDANMLLPFRYHKMRAEKLKIGKKAAELVEDGDTVFIDASTTAEFMTDFLTDKKNITVITNNIAVVTRLASYNIRVICLGGQVVEPPCMLDGADAVENASKYHADKTFFSTSSVSEDGLICTGEPYYMLHRVMIANADEVYYLFDHEKLRRTTGLKKSLIRFDEVTGVVSDHEFDEKIRKKFASTKFIKV